MSDTGEQLVITASGGALAVRGEIDAHTAPQLAEAIANSEPGDVVVDMSEVEFVDSSGLRTLIDAHQSARADGGRLVIRKPSAAVTRLFEISGVNGYLDVVAD